MIIECLIISIMYGRSSSDSVVICPPALTLSKAHVLTNTQKKKTRQIVRKMPFLKNKLVVFLNFIHLFNQFLLFIFLFIISLIQLIQLLIIFNINVTIILLDFLFY